MNTGKTPTGRPWHKWEINIEIDCIEIGFGGDDADWINLVQDRGQWWTLVNTVMQLQVS